MKGNLDENRLMLEHLMFWFAGLEYQGNTYCMYDYVYVCILYVCSYVCLCIYVRMNVWINEY